MSIILAFLAALFAALTSILAKIGIEQVNSNLATAVRTVVIVIMAFIIVIMTGELGSVFNISMKALLFLILSGLATGLSWLFFFKALSIGDVTKVVPIDKSSIALTILLSFVILSEPAAPLVLAGGAIITIGTFMLIGKKEKQPEGHSRAYLFPAILGAVFASLTAILAKIGIEDVDSNVATFIRTIVILLFAWGIVFFQRKVKELKMISKRSYLFLVLSGMATGFSWLCYFGAISLGKVSIVAPIDKFSVVFAMILSMIILREKPTKVTVAGSVVIMVGTLLLVI